LALWWSAQRFGPVGGPHAQPEQGAQHLNVEQVEQPGEQVDHLKKLE
jgi:hypothetical protein